MPLWFTSRFLRVLGILGILPVSPHGPDSFGYWSKLIDQEMDRRFESLVLFTKPFWGDPFCEPQPFAIPQASSCYPASNSHGTSPTGVPEDQVFLRKGPEKPRASGSMCQVGVEAEKKNAGINPFLGYLARSVQGSESF